MIAASSLKSEVQLIKHDRQNYEQAMIRQSPPELNSAQLLSDLAVICEDTQPSQPAPAPSVADIIQGIESPCTYEKGNTSESPTANLYKWFDDYNAHPEKGIPKYGDSGSPYFLQQNSLTSYRGSLDTARVSDLIRGGDGSTDEYRSVIDDLTIENKKLRDELRRYKKQTNRQLEKDKLFEIRIHSLPPSKRRELENALRSFASSLDYSSSGHMDSGQNISKPYPTSEEATISSTKKSITSSILDSRQQDSTYESMITSNQPNTANLECSNGQIDKSSQQSSSSSHSINNLKRKLQLDSLQSSFTDYGLANLTDAQKRRLVVQRLEQLFTGEKGAMMGGAHIQALHQQEISRSALDNDSDLQQIGGAREAHMRPQRNQIILNPNEVNNGPEVKPSSDLSDEVCSTTSSPDQRPTRPMDLDPDRAQVPSDNVEYIRHLGLSTPQLASDESSDSHRDKSGWVYLNLLINMAQLHIINVTSDFVRSAVLDVSEKFQLSKDGQMLRWKGGSTGTLLESDSGSSCGQESDSIRFQGLSNLHLIPDNGELSVQNHSLNNYLAEPQRCSSDFQYKPLFYHKSTSDNLSEGCDSLLGASNTDGSNSTQTSRLHTRRNRSHFLSTDRKQYEDGSIIFYSGVNFCTDLSRDREAGLQVPSSSSSSSILEEQCDDEKNQSFQAQTPSLARTDSGSLLPYRPFKDVSPLPNLDDAETNMISYFPMCVASGVENFSIKFPAESQQASQEAPSSLQPLKSSGVGGTSPSDYFEIRVLTHRSVLNEQSRQSNLSTTMDSNKISQKILNPFSESTTNLIEDKEMKNSIDTGLSHESRSAQQNSQQYVSKSKDLPIQTKIISTDISLLPPVKIPSPSIVAFSPDSNLGSENSLESADVPSRPFSSQIGVSNLPSL